MLAGTPVQPACVARPLAQGRRRLTVVAAVKEIFMPALSSTMTEGKIVSWLKSPGDKIAKGESVVCFLCGPRMNDLIIQMGTILLKAPYRLVATKSAAD